MEKFVNRVTELSLIGDLVSRLQNSQELPEAPIVEFYGIEGMGKTTLLQQVEETCHARQVLCERKDVREINVQNLTEVAHKLLAASKPVIMILDSFDTVSSEKQGEFERQLRDLIFAYSNLFFILACKSAYHFENTRSVAKKLTVHPLKPLSYKDCLDYLNSVDQELPSHIRVLIYEWTRGYPLAMTVITDAILQQHLNIEQDQDKIIHILIEEVIEKKLLANVASPAEKVRIQTLLALLSIPRRFNLTLIQKLIKKFTPEYQLESNLAYIRLLPSINEITNILKWNVEHAGYRIDASVRNLFLLQNRIEQPQRYTEIHRFLADKNKEFARQVSSPADRIGYMRESFYHLAYGEKENRVQEALAEYIEQLAQVQAQTEPQSLDDFLQFYGEFQRDDELKEALKPENTRFALSLMRKSFLKIYRQLSEGTRGLYLRKFFSHTAHKATTEDFALIFEDGMRQIIKQESLADAGKLNRELMQDKEVKDLLGDFFDQVKKRISMLLEEGQ